jgi:hypothetical protein
MLDWKQVRYNELMNENLEKSIEENIIDTTELENNILIINKLTKKFKNIDKEITKLKIHKISCIDYLHDVAIVANDFLEYSKEIYDTSNSFLHDVRDRGLNTVSIKEITDIEIEIDEKDNKISELNNIYIRIEEDYNELKNENTELKEIIFKLTSQK